MLDIKGDEFDAELRKIPRNYCWPSWPSGRRMQHGVQWVGGQLADGTSWPNSMGRLPWRLDYRQHRRFDGGRQGAEVGEEYPQKPNSVLKK